MSDQLGLHLKGEIEFHVVRVEPETIPSYPVAYFGEPGTVPSSPVAYLGEPVTLPSSSVAYLGEPQTVS